MTDDWIDTEWGQAVEYGRHIFGVFPNQVEQFTTGVLYHEGNYFESYVETGSWSRYPNWIQEYEQTPLKDALEGFAEEEGMHTTEGVFKNQHYKREVLESVGMIGWRYEYQRKRAFRKAVLRGDVKLGTPAVFNRYGDIYCPPDDAESVRELYWDYVDENYDKRHSHHSETKTQEA